MKENAMTGYQRILVPTDFSDGAAHALAYGCEIARADGGQVHVVHAIEDEVLFAQGGELPVPPPAGYIAELRDAARAALAGIPEPSPPLAGGMVRDMVSALAPEGILKYAQEHAIDLICLGTHGRSGLSRFIIGSVAERVVQYAPCSVLVVRRKQHPFVTPDDGTVRINRILAPADFSEFTAPALEHAFHLAGKFQADVDLLHVVEENSPVRSEALKAYPVIRQYVSSLCESAESQLAALAPPAGSSIRVERHVRIGRPSQEIVEQAKEHFADLIVTGTHGRTGVAHWFLGSVAEMVVRKAPCPVLVVRPGKTAS